MRKILTTFFSIALSAVVLGAGNDGGNGSDEPGSGSVNATGSGRGALTRPVNATLPFDPESVIGSTSSGSGEINTFIETYDDGTDVGLWHCSLGVPRTIEASGGNPGAYLQQGGFSSHVPTWASISTRFQPGVNDPYKIDSIYTGDWTSLGVTTITVDLNILQVATWGTDRAVTL